MGLLDRVEKKIEGAVNGVFARAFKGDVQPVEIAARLQRELDSEAKLLSRDKRLVPNVFRVGLSARDHDRLAPYAKTLNAEIVPELREYAGERRYVFNGPISIDYELDESLPTGRFTVSSQAAATVASADHPGSTRVMSSRLVLEVNGVRHPLSEPGLLIGRGSEADLRINDPGISRKHAMIHVSGQGVAQRVTIEDLGSTNGIVVNGTKCRQATITDGTRLEIGTTRMLVHALLGREVSELIVATLKVAFLALMWVFILFAANVIRTDMFGRQVASTSPELGYAAPAPTKRAKRAARNAPAVLRVVEGRQAGLTIPLEGTVALGRAADSTLYLDDDFASTRHAQLTRDDQGNWWIEDLRSTNGTAVNTMLINNATRLTTGDTIRIGRTHMRVEKQ